LFGFIKTLTNKSMSFDRHGCSSQQLDEFDCRLQTEFVDEDEDFARREQQTTAVKRSTRSSVNCFDESSTTSRMISDGTFSFAVTRSVALAKRHTCSVRVHHEQHERPIVRIDRHRFSTRSSSTMIMLNNGFNRPNKCRVSHRRSILSSRRTAIEQRSCSTFHSVLLLTTTIIVLLLLFIDGTNSSNGELEPTRRSQRRTRDIGLSTRTRTDSESSTASIRRCFCM
jgi:hypothetical protein